MKTNFKALSLATAVAAATAGISGVANAQAVATSELGDMAIVPYYTTLGDFVTGVHIINTSDLTQVVKIRLRRASDSMDALDFNLILSPQDEWAGFLASADDSGDITFNTNDNSCTAPLNSGSFTMPGIYRNGADTGYIEVIGMGTPTDENLVGGIATAALHDSDGMPFDCTAVASNFFANGVATTTKGNVDSYTTVQANTAVGLPALVLNEFDESENALKVSYFIRDAASGVEFGNNAVHIEDFMTDASMTNQEFGVFSGDLQGFDFPDLNGPAPEAFAAFGPRSNYEDLRSAIGGASVINDWSANQSEAGFTVGTDWVVTVPGQYVMLDLMTYLTSLIDEDVDCLGLVAATAASEEACDYRDIPLTASFTVYDREEQGIVTESGDLVVSPSLPGSPNVTLLDKEVNVIEWGVSPVLGAPDPISVATPGDAVNGWASLAVTPWAGTTAAVCNFDGVAVTGPTTDCGVGGDGTVVNADEIPMVGFVAWERSYAANPDANYGRIIGHSYAGSSAPAP